MAFSRRTSVFTSILFIGAVCLAVRVSYAQCGYFLESEDVESCGKDFKVNAHPLPVYYKSEEDAVLNTEDQGETAKLKCNCKYGYSGNISGSCDYDYETVQTREIPTANVKSTCAKKPKDLCGCPPFLTL